MIIVMMMMMLMMTMMTLIVMMMMLVSLYMPQARVGNVIIIITSISKNYDDHECLRSASASE